MFPNVSWHDHTVSTYTECLDGRGDLDKDLESFWELFGEGDHIDMFCDPRNEAELKTNKPRFQIDLNRELSLFDTAGWQLGYRAKDVLIFVDLRCSRKCIFTNALMEYRDRVRISGTLSGMNEFLRQVTVKVSSSSTVKEEQLITVAAWDAALTNELATYEEEIHHVDDYSFSLVIKISINMLS